MENNQDEIRRLRTQEHDELRKLRILREQDELRVAVLNRCKSQKEIAEEIGVSNIYLNTWLKGKRMISKKLAGKIQVWLST